MTATTAMTLTPLDRYLAEQGNLTAVDRFSKLDSDDLIPSQARYYRDLIPMAQPQPGQQYGFEVELDSCTGCKACVTACHSLNGLDEDESWRSVGLLHGGPSGGSELRSQQTVTAGCHHCVDPACLNGCPVNAYEKDPVTGIVAHLDDQCIGCGYCMLTCPYEVPRYNSSRGIVRKCDMCADRLAVGEAPACVQACPNQAIRISIVDQDSIVARALITRLIPGAPVSSITNPSTVYLTERHEVRSMQPADLFALRPAQAHPPLAVMLVITQLSVGAFLTDLGLRRYASRSVVEALRPYNALVALGMGLVALAASVLHLGRPKYAFRAVIGLRHSWLSREIVAFGLFAALAGTYSIVLWWKPMADHFLVTALGALVGAVGTAAVGCSVKIYTVTRKGWWQPRFTLTKFALTAAVCGLATVLLTSLVVASVVGGDLAASAPRAILRPLGLLLVVTATVKLLWEAFFFRHVSDEGITEVKRTAMLLVGALRPSTICRFALSAIGAIGAPLLAMGVTAHTTAARSTGPLVVSASVLAIGLAGTVAGELIERYQFFRAVSAPRMPGLIS